MASAVADDVFSEIEKTFQAENAESKKADNAKAAQSLRPSEELATLADGKAPLPDFIKAIHQDYQSGIAHCWIIHGNTEDYLDQSGSRGSLETLLASVFDTRWLTHRLEEAAAKSGKSINVKVPDMSRIFAYYTAPNGLSFADADSRKAWLDMMRGYWKDKMSESVLEQALNPTRDIVSVLQTINMTFEASKAIVALNRAATSVKIHKEHMFTIAFRDGDGLFPNGPMQHLQSDRDPILFIRNWSRDQQIGERNRILIITRNLEDIHESIRGGDSGVNAIRIPRPKLEQRESWLVNFDSRLKAMPEDKRPFIGGKRRDTIAYAPDIDHRIMAVQCAGLNLIQQEQIIRMSWRNNQLVDQDLIKEHKQRVITAAYGNQVSFVEPTFGFDHIGGHEHLIGTAKDRSTGYFIRKITNPLRTGNRRTCSRGVILTGPPGTGKTQLAQALAFESKLNFLEGKIGQLFGGIVGETEAKTAKFMEAVYSSAPVILFLDEIESVLSSGRSSPGDSGTAARVFNEFMKFLSDESRVGKVVVIAATNRPDLLDAAFIRNGRFDAIIPTLPPMSEDARGRTEILKALSRKHRVKFDKQLASTVKGKEAGLGRLLNDERIWTGAEIQAVLTEAIDNCQFRHELAVTTATEAGDQAAIKKAEADLKGCEDNPVIVQSDWDEAMDSVVPNTREVELQIDLALYYVNNLKYCPKDWLERAKNKKELKDNIHTGLAEAGFSREV